MATLVCQHEAREAGELTGKEYGPGVCRVCWLFANDARYAGKLFLANAPVMVRDNGRTYKQRSPAKGLGDVIEAGLTFFGVTKARVSKWLGRPCNCTERQTKLNKLGAWAAAWIGGKSADGKGEIEAMLKDRKGDGK